MSDLGQGLPESPSSIASLFSELPDKAVASPSAKIGYVNGLPLSLVYVAESPGTIGSPSLGPGLLAGEFLSEGDWEDMAWPPPLGWLGLGLGRTCPESANKLPVLGNSENKKSRRLAERQDVLNPLNQCNATRKRVGVWAQWVMQSALGIRQGEYESSE